MPSLPPLPPPYIIPFKIYITLHTLVCRIGIRGEYTYVGHLNRPIFLWGGGLYKEKVPYFVRGNTENDASLFTPYTACPSLLSIPPPKKKQSVTICTTDVQYTLSMCVFVSLSNFFIKVIQIRI